MKIAIASDHRGFRAKAAVTAVVELLGHEVLDLGPQDNQSCDYPDVAVRVRDSLAVRRNELGG